MPPATEPRCVIIDDDPTTLRIVNHYTREMLGVESACFDNPSDALDYAAINRNISIILVDWHIGDINGLRWLEPLSREWPLAVVIVISGDADPNGLIEASRSGRVSLWWRKTDSVAMLASLLNVAMQEHERRVSGDAFKTLADIKDTAIRGAVSNHGGNIDLAAKELGVSPSTIRRHLSP